MAEETDLSLMRYIGRLIKEIKLTEEYLDAKRRKLKAAQERLRVAPRAWTPTTNNADPVGVDEDIYGH